MRPAPASGAGGFQTLERHGQTYIFPDAALPYLRGGLLEERLFNVTDLAAAGYTDLPLIVEYGTDAANAVRTRKLLAQPAPAGARKVRELPSVGAVAVSVPRTGAAAFWGAVDDDRPTAPTGPHVRPGHPPDLARRHGDAPRSTSASRRSARPRPGRPASTAPA